MRKSRPFKDQRRKREEGPIMEQARRMHSIGGWHMMRTEWLLVMSLEEAFMLGYLISFASMQEAEDRTNGDWFKISRERLCKKLCISSHRHRRILASLETKGIVERRMAGNPAKRWLCINFVMLENLIQEKSDEVEKTQSGTVLRIRPN